MNRVSPPGDGTGCARAWLPRVAAGYVRVVEDLAVLAVAMLALVAILQVVCRYVVGASLFWSEELMRYIMIWMSMLIAGVAYSRGAMLGMRAIVDLLPPRRRRWAELLGCLGSLFLLGMIAWYGWRFALRTARDESVALQISMFWVHAAVPLGAVLIALHVIAEQVRNWVPGMRDEQGEAP